LLGQLAALCRELLNLARAVVQQRFQLRDPAPVRHDLAITARWALDEIFLCGHAPIEAVTAWTDQWDLAVSHPFLVLA
jgi:hypothetical protein